MMCPATDTVAVRALPVFAATSIWTDPGPVPVAPVAIVIHGAPLTAVHAQEAATATTMGSPVPPLAPTECDVGETADPHDGTPGWLISATSPLMAMNPVRAAAVFAATVNVTVPGPTPLPDAIVIHRSSVAAAQAQAGEVLIDSGVPAPPFTATDCDAGVISYWQAAVGAAACVTTHR
jgi:hypothetical protein